MSFRVRIFGCGICTVALVAAIAVIQNRAVDANNPQPAAPETAADKTTAIPDANDTVYFDLAAPLKAAQETENAIRKALEKPIAVKFNETPLNEAIAHIGKLCGVQIDINATALNEEGITLDQPITFTREQPLPAKTVLASMLEPLGLAAAVENELLTIMTVVDVEETLHTCLYDASSLALADFTTDSIADLILSETSGPWMEIDGTGGTVSVFEHLLVIRTTEKVHSETRGTLDVLKTISTSPNKNGTAPLFMSADERKVYRVLSRKVSGDFRETPLKDVAAFLAKLTGVQVKLNETALTEEGIDPNEPVTIKIKDVTLRSALRRISEPLGLTHIIEDGVLKITTEIDAEEIMTTFAFNVRDFAAANYSMETLIEHIQQESSGPWFETDGTGGSINDTLPGFLIIQQTWKNQEEAAMLLDELRALLKKSSPDGKLPKVTRDPKADGLTLKQYHITSLPIEDVRDAITKFVEPNSWRSAGGKGKGDLAIIETKIVIRQSRDVHKKIDKFLYDIGEGFGGGLDLGSGGFGSGGSFFSID